jgi:histidinol dehydrogenase
VSGVISDIRQQGDQAIRKYSEKFDKWSPSSFLLSAEDIKDIIATVPDQIIADIKTVQANVRAFAERQKASTNDFEVEIRPGVYLGQKTNPIEVVGW